MSIRSPTKTNLFYSRKTPLKKLIVAIIFLSLSALLAGLYFKPQSQAIPGDFNGDGFSDILWHNQVNGDNNIWSINKTEITDVTKIQSTGENGYFLGQADFNLDGTADLLSYNAYQNIYVFWFMAKGVRESWARLKYAMPPGSSIASIGDFIGSSHPDLLIRQESGQLLLLELQKEKITKVHQTGITIGPTVKGVPGDFIKDSKQELLIQSPDGYKLLSFNGHQNTQITTSLPLKSKILDVADFYGTGKQAILVRPKIGINLEIWRFNQREQLNLVSTIQLKSRLQQFQQTGFFNADPYPDILLKKITTNTTSIVLLDKGKIIDEKRLKSMLDVQAVALPGTMKIPGPRFLKNQDCQFDTKLFNIVDTNFECQEDVDQLILENLRKNLAGEELRYFYESFFENTVRYADIFITRGFKKRDNPNYLFGKPFDWGNNPKIDNLWHMNINAWAPMAPVIQAYIKSNDKKYLQAANQMALDWIDYNVTQEQPNAYAWYDHATGLRAAKLSYLLREALKKPDNQETIPLLVAADRHLQELSDITKLNLANHGIFQLVGLVALCKAVPQLSSCKIAEPWAMDRIPEVLATQYNHEGMHLEHSPTYHLWVLKKILAMQETGWFDEILDQKTETIKENAVWLFHPDGTIVTLGDTFPSNQNLYKIDHPYFLAKMTEGQQGTFPQTTDKIWWDTGYGVLRSKWQTPLNLQSYLFLSAAYHSFVHKHPDDLTIEWSEFGERILVEIGAYSYKHCPLRVYAQSTRAHNTVEIDHKNFVFEVSNNNYLYTEQAYGSGMKEYQSSGDLKFIEAQVNHTNEGVIHNRKLFIKERQWLLVIDQLQSPNEHEYIQWFHFPADIEVETQGRGYTAVLPVSKKKLFIADLITGKPDLLIKGQEKPYMQGWTGKGYNQPQETLPLAMRKKVEIPYMPHCLPSKSCQKAAKPKSRSNQIESRSAGQVKMESKESPGQKSTTPFPSVALEDLKLHKDFPLHLLLGEK